MDRSRFHTVLLAVCTVSLAMIAGRLIASGGAPRAAGVIRSIKLTREWATLKATGNTIGKGDGSITLLEFSDFQCPYCAQATNTLSELQSKYPHQLLIRYRHLPLAIHEHAIAAAEASECANDQGRFEQFHDALFERQDDIGKIPFRDFAKVANVPDVGTFEKCIELHRHAGRVHADAAEAKRLGIDRTPTFVIGGKVITGAVPLSELEKFVEASRL